MNKTKFILPLIALFSLSSCGSESQLAIRQAEQGKVPEGGTLIQGRGPKIDGLARALKSAQEEVKNITDFGVTVTCDGLQAELASEKLNGTLTLGEFSLLAGATNLFNGTKENTKIGLEFSGLKSTADLTRVKQEAAEDFELKAERTVGKCAAYLDNGSIYVDLTDFGVPEIVSETAEFIEPYVPLAIEIAELDKMTSTFVTYLVSQFAESPENVTKVVSSMFGCSNPEDFEYKLAFKNQLKDEDYPLIPEDLNIPDDKFEETAELICDRFTDETGLNFDDTVKVYQYEDHALAFELTIGKEELETVLRKHVVADFDYTVNDGELSIALYLNQKGLPSSLSIVNDMDFTISGDEADARFGGDLSVITNTAIDANLSLDSNPITFPEDYKDYYDLSPLASLITFIRS